MTLSPKVGSILSKIEHVLEQLSLVEVNLSFEHFVDADAVKYFLLQRTFVADVFEHFIDADAVMDIVLQRTFVADAFK